MRIDLRVQQPDLVDCLSVLFEVAGYERFVAHLRIGILSDGCYPWQCLEGSF
jgi:hypothetical protein